MKLSDIKIENQLRAGLGFIFFLVVLLGAAAWYQSDIIWQQTQGLYDHPFVVQNTIGNLRTDILAINGELKDVAIADSDQKIQPIIQTIDTDEANAFQQFTVLYDRYLGPRSDIDEVYAAFVQWKAIRESIIQLRRQGKGGEAALAASSSGPEGAAVDKILAQIQDVSNFASNRANTFMLDAQKERTNLVIQLVILIAVILGLGMLTSYFLLNGITVPLKDLTAATFNFSKGNLDSRCHYVSKNELGQLTSSFNELAESIQNEFQSKQKVAHLSEVMLREEELHAFCMELLKVLVTHTESQIGAIYLLNAEKTEFEPVESIGLNSSARAANFSAQGNEGEFGAVLMTREIHSITLIPEDTRFVFSAVSGDMKPREIITIPILSGSNVIAVISLASIRNYSASAHQFVKDIWNVLAARLNGVLFFQQVRTYSEKLGSQNWELEQQAKELAIQTDELSEQNIELELQKKQLDESNRLKSAFLSNMSHELRTPLNSVIALTEVLSRRLRSVIPDEEYSYLDIIERNGKGLLNLINDILDLSRVEAGREEISISRFSANELVSDVVEMILPQAVKKNIALINQASTEIPTIASDYSKSRHILQNIIGNAVKFTEEGMVVVSVAQEDSQIRFSVMDTGIGITDDQLPYIFDEFRQADESTSRKYGGTGLGLAIAQKYATLLHGSIIVKSMPGEGTTFTFVLPIEYSAPENNTPLERSKERSTSYQFPEQIFPQPGCGKKILVVEDSDPAIIQLNDLLVEQGYVVQVAHNGREALGQIPISLPDAIILDLMMPEIDGFQVLRMIREEERTAQIPVLILTAKQITTEELAFLKGNHIHQLIQKGDINKKDLLISIARMVSPPPLEKERKPVHKKNRKWDSEKPVVLVVEDNPDNRRTVDALLKETCSVIEAGDGPSGIELAKKSLPNLILLDISLPGMDGFKVLDEIRNGETTRHIPVLALTARAMKGDRERILTYGFDGYVSKPIEFDVLKRMVDEMIYGE